MSSEDGCGSSVVVTVHFATIVLLQNALCVAVKFAFGKFGCTTPNDCSNTSIIGNRGINNVDLGIVTNNSIAFASSYDALRGSHGRQMCEKELRSS